VIFSIFFIQKRASGNLNVKLLEVFKNSYKSSIEVLIA